MGKTTLPVDRAAQLALRLYRARKGRSQVPQFSRELPDLSIEDAYATQAAARDDVLRADYGPLGCLSFKLT